MVVHRGSARTAGLDWPVGFRLRALAHRRPALIATVKIALNLSTDESIALRRLANDLGCSHEDAAKTALRDWLIAGGYLELEHELDEDTETVEEA